MKIIISVVAALLLSSVPGFSATYFCDIAMTPAPACGGETFGNHLGGLTINTDDKAFQEASQKDGLAVFGSGFSWVPDINKPCNAPNEGKIPTLEFDVRDTNDGKLETLIYSSGTGIPTQKITNAQVIGTKRIASSATDLIWGKIHFDFACVLQ